MSGIGYFSRHTILCHGKPFPEPVVRNLGSKLSVLWLGGHQVAWFINHFQRSGMGDKEHTRT